ncbi:FecR domain-containing protein [Pseudomonas sp. RIT-To-2]|uniref:FecR domain-containing protein n=1 Tax=Pseudomonas sp. RIT-To-2 TaxID=3462541 RepID=UPI002413528B
MIDADLQRTIDEAAHWLARLHAHDCHDQEREALAQWQRADPRHREVFEKMAGQVGSLRAQPLLDQPQEQLVQLLNVPSTSRRRVLGGLATLGMVLAGLAQFEPRLRPGWLDVGLSTGTGQRATFTLGDASRLTLNACSQVDPDMNARQRRLVIGHGQAYLQCQADPRGPLVIASHYGQVLSQQASLVISQDEQGARLDVLQASVLLQARDGRALTIKAGQSAVFNNQGTVALGPTRGNRLAWLNGQLDIDNEPLATVVDALRAYRRGIVRVSPAAARLKVSGVFVLDDTDTTLSLLALSLPIRVTRHTDYWLNIDALHEPA